MPKENDWTLVNECDVHLKVYSYKGDKEDAFNKNCPNCSDGIVRMRKIGKLLIFKQRKEIELYNYECNSCGFRLLTTKRLIYEDEGIFF